MATRSSILAWNGQRSLVGYRPRDHKELDMTAQLEDNNRTYPSTETFLLIVIGHSV